MAEPYCLAMVLCDAVYRDAATGKFTLLGTFSTISAQEYPATVNFFVYSAITDGSGPTSLKLRLVNAEVGLVDTEGGGVVFEMVSEVLFEDPLVVFEIAIGVQTALPAPDLYHCELWAGDELLMSRRMLAMKTDGNEEETDEHSNDQTG